MWKFAYFVKNVYINCMKTCNKCKQTKETVDFHTLKSSKDGLYTQCKSCKKEYDKRYRKSDKIQSLYKSKAYRDRKKEYKKFISNTSPEKMLWIAAKTRAKAQNVPFTITVEDIKIPEYCPILEIKLERKEYGKRGSFEPHSPSLDKIIPSLGYTKDNIAVISMKANAMKYNATKEELIKFSKNILKLFNDNNI